MKLSLAQRPLWLLTMAATCLLSAFPGIPSCEALKSPLQIRRKATFRNTIQNKRILDLSGGSGALRATTTANSDNVQLRNIALLKSLKSMIGFTTLFLLVFILPSYLLSGNWRWKRGWLYIGIWALSHLSVNLPMAYHYPATYIMREGSTFDAEQPKLDKLASWLIIVALYLCFLLAPIHTFALSTNHDFFPIIPEWLSIMGMVLHCLGYVSFHVVPIQNPHARKNLAPQPNQRIVQKGLYRYVRHPMYSGLLLWLVGISLYFQSWLSFSTLLLIVVALFIRVSLEEAQLKEGLEYQEYMKQVPCRFIPFLL